ncbi:MAG: hypothetical protein OEQ74_08330 [Gammaproteobacteria bacterium]|nr:hypothetical protein [Gammaproteobacteria bacterium]
MILLLVLLLPTVAFAQIDTLQGTDNLESISEGWQGFSDVGFLLNLLVSLLLATALSAVIGFHPRTYGKLGSPAELDKPKAYVIYGVIGAVIGTLVLKYGPIVGLVVFGIGGLLRFRTNLGSPTMTGMAILVTLIGLCCGLNLPHVAIVATVFGFTLIYVLERRKVFSIVIKGLDSASLPAAAQAYRRLLDDNDFSILSEQKNFIKRNITMVFSGGKTDAREALELQFATRIPAKIRGSIDWTSG